jgi:hypothetical protein
VSARTQRRRGHANLAAAAGDYNASALDDDRRERDALNELGRRGFSVHCVTATVESQWWVAKADGWLVAASSPHRIAHYVHHQHSKQATRGRIDR